MPGEWDPHRIDTKGFYARFVVRKIVLDSLLSWMSDQRKLGADERLYDASAVLSGTMLMASAISGSGPQTFDSNVNLVTLLPKVARQRDAFYERLMNGAKGARRTRLRKEAKLTQQPFGHIRQHLNITLARYGARQVQDRHVSRLYAQLGYPQASREQSSLVPAASARFETEIEWRLVSAQRGLQRGEVDEVKRLLAEVEDHLDRGIGVRGAALADPWNIIGFQGMFPLFSSREDVVPDQRIADLIEIVESLFGIYSLALGEAAAVSDPETFTSLSSAFERRAQWWDKFGASTVEDLPKVLGTGKQWQSVSARGFDPPAFKHGDRPAKRRAIFRSGGRMWNNSESVKSYALVVDVLCVRRRDYVAAMGLLIQWLEQQRKRPARSGRVIRFTPCLTAGSR